jgi:hypothetical protein
VILTGEQRTGGQNLGVEKACGYGMLNLETWRRRTTWAADPTRHMDPEENVADDGDEALVRRYYEEALNPGRFDQLEDLLAEEFVDHEELRGIPRPATA